MSERNEFAANKPVEVLDRSVNEGVDSRSGLLSRGQARSGQKVLQEETNGAENLSLSDKAKAAIDVLFATPKSVVQYAEGKVAAFLVERTPVGVLVKGLQTGLSSGLPSDVKQIAQGKTESLSLREVIASNIKDSTKQVLSHFSEHNR